MQLVAYGAQDIYLTGNPQITFFKVVYRRHTNFSVESIEQTFDGAVGFQKKVTCTISRNGDLIGSTYLECDLSTKKTSLLQNVHDNAFALIDKVELEIGGQMIDRHYGQWMNIWAELTHGSEKKAMLRNMVNAQFVENLNNNTAAANNKPHFTKVYIPLLFFFCTNPGLALPLIALQYHEVKINLTFAKRTDMARFGSCGGDTIEMQASDCCGDEDLFLDNASLWCDYIYLDTDERRRFAQTSHEYLITQVQHSINNTVSKGESNVNLTLNFNHPVKELIWVVQSQYGETAHKGAHKLNYWNNHQVGLDQVKDACLQLNGHERFARRNGSYFRKVQRYQHHTGSESIDRIINVGMLAGCMDTGSHDANADQINDASTFDFEATNSGGVGKNIGQVVNMGSCIYIYSFALSPEEHQPSGTCNFSRIDNAVLQLTLNKDAAMDAGEANVYSHSAAFADGDQATRAVSVYAPNYNVLRIMSGMGGLAYSN